MAVKSIGGPLQFRNYRLFLLGQAISQTGTWMQQVAMAWLLYRLTNSPFLLGLIGFAGQIPFLFLSPFAGVAADRWNRRRALLITQFAAMVQAVLVLVLVMVPIPISIVWPLIGLGFLLGVVNTFDVPFRTSFLVDMVPEREHLGRAIALNALIVNGARLIGPSLAGMIIAGWGESACFLLNAASYVAVLLALLGMRDLPVRTVHPDIGVMEHLKEGIAYAFGFAPLRALLAILATISMMAMSMNILMPVFARNVLHGNADTQGFLMGALGGGALVASFYLSLKKSVLGLGRIIVVSTAFYGVGQIAFSFSSNIWISLPILGVVGCCMMLHLASSNILIQTVVEEDKRGRLMSLFSMAFMGVGPIGGLLGGTLADTVGAPIVVRLSGGICIIAALLFGIQLPRMRHQFHPLAAEPVELTKEILEEIESGE